MTNEVIEEHAKRVASRTIQNLISTTLAKNKLDELLLPYTTAKNKHIFIKALKREAEAELIVHRKKCTKTDCAQVKGFGYLTFAIDQEMENIYKNYVPGDYGNSLEFSTEERLMVNDKLDEVLNSLNNLGLGQQILFEELNNLREHFNLNKKNWLQLFKGKLLEITAEKLIEITIANMIFKTVTESINAGQFLLPK